MLLLQPEHHNHVVDGNGNVSKLLYTNNCIILLTLLRNVASLKHLLVEPTLRT